MVNRVHLEHTIWPYKHRFLTRLVGIIHDPRGAGVPLKIIGGVVRPGSQTEILTLAISDEKNVIFRTRFQIWPLKRNYVIIT